MRYFIKKIILCLSNFTYYIMAEVLFGIWLHLCGIIIQTIYGNQPYIDEAIYLKITLRNMFI